MYDVIVIGGGVIGGTILRELSKYNYSICMLEKENDVCMGQSKANSGIVHAGFDAKEGSLKAKFNVWGSKIMKDYAEELGVKYENNGSLVVAFTEEDLLTIKELKERGEKNGVKDLEIIDQNRLFAMEQNISHEALGALYVPTAGIICPYCLTIASIGNAMDNGAELMTDFEVVGATKIKNGFEISSSDGRTVSGKIVVNATGLGSSKVSSIFGDDSFNVKGKRGEYILLDRESGDFVSHTLFFTPTDKGKGILVTQTVDHNILLGPTSEKVEKTEPITTQKGLAEVMSKASSMCVNVPFYNSITSFTGVRAYTDKGDFIIEESKIVKNLINCIGIESPGLSSAPAIAEYVSDMINKKLKGEKKIDFIAKRKPEYFFKDLTTAEKNELIAKEPAYGRIICRCEQITEGEIIHAIHDNPPAKNIDAIKRRTRAGMGRCQGGFCQPQVAEILARELGVDLTEITKNGKGSELVISKTK